MILELKHSADLDLQVADSRLKVENVRTIDAADLYFCFNPDNSHSLHLPHQILSPLSVAFRMFDSKVDLFSPPHLCSPLKQSMRKKKIS